MSKMIDVNQMRDLINKGEATDPLVFLESIMNGQDPRKLSNVYELVMEINEFSGGEPPTKSEWNELVDLISKTCKYTTVNINQSTNAAKTLAEYLHAKRKQIEKTSSGAEENIRQQPLTEEEIILFRERFNEAF